MLTFANPGDQISLITIKKLDYTQINAYTFPSLYCTDMKWSFEFSDYFENVIYVSADSNKTNEPILCKFLLDMDIMTGWYIFNNMALVQKFIAYGNHLVLFSDTSFSNERRTLIHKMSFSNLLLNHTRIVDQQYGAINR